MGPTYIFLTTAKSIKNFYNCPKIHNVGSNHRHVTNKKSQMTSYFLHTPLSPLRNVISFLLFLTCSSSPTVPVPVKALIFMKS